MNKSCIFETDANYKMLVCKRWQRKIVFVKHTIPEMLHCDI